MTSRLINLEPIPGYRLLERLGRGGYGEVWKVEAPGGIFKAMKFVYGDLHQAGDSSEGAEQELKSLNRVKTIRHPYVLSIERFDIIDGQLVIVMELADRNLYDRFEECRAHGLTGIPRDELMRFLDETAEALDLMNVQYQIQHLDIKPQNLFLVHNHIKVADFGLAKDFEGVRGTMTGGVTPVYAAPETFEGWVSRFSDQYSLAIVYQELLTGSRPFSGTNARQLLLQHLSQDPEVACLPLGEQAVVRKALSKNPEDRFNTCAEFVQALRNPNAYHMGVSSSPVSTTVPVRVEATNLTGTQTQPRRPGIDGPNPNNPPPLVIDVQRVPKSNPGLKSLPSLRTPQQTTPTGKSNHTPSHAITQLRPSAFHTNHISKLGIAPPERSATGVLFPALVIALGKTGLTVLQRFRQTLFDHFGSNGRMPNLRCLYLDTDIETIQTAVQMTGPQALDNSEIVVTRLNRPAQYTKRDDLPPIDSWLSNELLYRMPRTPSTMGMRSLGRLALCDHYPTISQRIRSELESLMVDDVIAETDRQTHLGFRSNRPRVYVVSSLAGGTGSGMIVDLAYVIRKELRQLGYDKPDLTGMLFVPQVDRNTPKSLPIANTLAALIEIEHFSRSFTKYETRFEVKGNPIIDADPPYRRCALLQLPKTNDAKSMQAVADLGAGLLFQEMFSPMGRVIDDTRSSYLNVHRVAGMPFQTFGMYRLSWPRHQLLYLSMYRFSMQLLDRWNEMDISPSKPEILQWINEQWERRELHQEAIRSLINRWISEEVGGDPGAILDQRVAALIPEVGKSIRIDGLTACRAFDDLLKLVGKPGKEEEDCPGRLGSSIEERCRKVARDFEDRLASMPAHFIEDPRSRLTGAEEAIRLLKEKIQEITQKLTLESRELEQSAWDDYNNLFPLIGSLDAKGIARWTQSRGLSGIEVLQLLVSYGKKRIAYLLQRSILGVYRILMGHIPELLREISYCRGQITDMRERLVHQYRAELNPPPAFEHAILPNGCENLKEAASQFVRSFSEKEYLEFEEFFQGQLQRQCKGLLNVCVRLDEFFPKFAEILENQTREFLDLRLQKATPAEIFFEHRSDLQGAQREIHRAFDESIPELADSRHKSDAHIFVLAVPFDRTGESFRQLTRDVLSDVDLVASDSPHDIIFYREQRHIPLSQLPQTGIFAQEAFTAIVVQDRISPYSRSDIQWTSIQDMVSSG